MESNNVLSEFEKYKSQICENRRYIHSHPGTEFDIQETVDYVRKQLISFGYEPQDCGKAGLVATVGGKKQGKVFMIRGDMDALPIVEESGEEFASTNGKMHACGHDMHTAMMLGAARYLKEHEDEIQGTIKLMLQPAEEIFEGSKDMIDDGLLDNPKVDAAMMIHVMAGMPFEPGAVVVSEKGVSAPAADYFEIKVKGVGCHGSMPNTGVDPINIAAHIIIALQEIQARELAISDREALTIGTINGGNAANAIPDMVTLGGSIRTFDESVRQLIKVRLEEIAKGVAKTFRGEAQVIWGSGCPTLYNNEELVKSAEKYTKELLGNKKAFATRDLQASGGSSKTAGSEDFAYISQEVPSVMLALAAGQPDKGYMYPQHHPKVKFDEEALVPGSAVYAYVAMRWLEEH